MSLHTLHSRIITIQYAIYINHSIFLCDERAYSKIPSWIWRFPMARDTHFDHDDFKFSPAPVAPAQVAGPAAARVSFWSWLRGALAVRRERRALMGLCERMRVDIGLSQADVYREGTRAFHDLPVDPMFPRRTYRGRL
jgi:uncharacterized protein YjiS (DUF1127 family)